MSFANTLDRLSDRAAELSAMLSEVTGEAYVKASKELAELDPIVSAIAELRAAEQSAAEAEAMLADPEMRELAEAELAELKTRIPELSHAIRLALLPKD